MSAEVRSTSFLRGGTREIVVKEGVRYVIKPTNPLTKKNRDRTVEVLGFTKGSWGETVVVVRYLDNNRRGRVTDLASLVPLDAEQPQ